MRKLYEIVDRNLNTYKYQEGDIEILNSSYIKLTLRPVKEWTKMSEQKPKEGQEIITSFFSKQVEGWAVSYPWKYEEKYFEINKSVWWKPWTPPEEEEYEFEKWFKDDFMPKHLQNTPVMELVFPKEKEHMRQAWNAARGKV